MIGHQSLGRSFKSLGSYLLTGKDHVHPDQRVAWMEFCHLPTDRLDVAARLMAATARVSVATQQPVFHLSISFAPGDPVDHDVMLGVMVRTLAEIGLGDHQAAIVAHSDTPQPHAHAMVNRVHPETGRAWKGSWSKLRIEASLRRQELELGLRVVPGWLAPVPGATELRPQRRGARGDVEFLLGVQERAAPVLERAPSWVELETGLAEVGLAVRVNGRGMSVTDGQREVKASEVGRAFSRSHLEKRLGRYSDYRTRATVASMASHEPNAEMPSPQDPALVIAPAPASSATLDLVWETDRDRKKEKTTAPLESAELPAAQGTDVIPAPAPALDRSRERLQEWIPASHRPTAPQSAVRPEQPVPKPASELPVAPSSDANAFIGLVHLRLRCETLQAAVDDANAVMQHVESWDRALQQAGEDVRGATTGFGEAIRESFREPDAFVRAFRQLDDERKRSVLRMLRDKPEVFADGLLRGFGAEDRSASQVGDWRASVAAAAKRLAGTSPAHRVFRDARQTPRVSVLTADAGERYLDAVRARNRTREYVAEKLGLSHSAPVRDVAEACRTRRAAAKELKVRSIDQRDALGEVPSRAELAHRFLRVPWEEQAKLRVSSPDARRLLAEVARLAETLGRGPERDHGGWGL